MVEYCPKCYDSHVFECRDKPGWFKCQECGELFQEEQVFTSGQVYIMASKFTFNMSERSTYRYLTQIGGLNLGEVTVNEDRISFSSADSIQYSIGCRPAAGDVKIPLIPGTVSVTGENITELRPGPRHPYLKVAIPRAESGQNITVKGHFDTTFLTGPPANS